MGPDRYMLELELSVSQQTECDHEGKELKVWLVLSVGPRGHHLQDLEKINGFTHWC